jgi:hypothetical protein
MNGEWILGIQIDGEWEHCRFPSQTSALGAFTDISADYADKIERAILIRTAPVRISRVPVSPLVQ